MKLNNLNISKMTLEDLEEIKENLQSDFDDFWNYFIFKSELENSNSTYFVLKNNDEIIGFAGCLIVLDTADITNIVIKKTYRNLGMSKILLEHLLKYCKTNNCCLVNLEVNSNNLIAIKLYKDFDFEQVGLRKNYYLNSDALLFTKKLGN